MARDANPQAVCPVASLAVSEALQSWMPVREVNSVCPARSCELQVTVDDEQGPVSACDVSELLGCFPALRFCQVFVSKLDSYPSGRCSDQQVSSSFG